jgi:cation transport ATPase
MNNKVEICLNAAGRAARKLQTGFSKAKNTCLNQARAGLPVFAFLALPLLLSTAANAQGPIFTGDAGNLSNIIREALKLMAIVLFCLGAVGIAWAIYNKMTGKEWGSQAFGAILSFAFGTIVAVFWQIAQGRAVSVDTNF